MDRLAEAIAFTLAHPDHYEPVEISPPGVLYRPAAPPAGWSQDKSGIWTAWTPPGAVLADQGWKIHVSSTLENAQPVLDVVSTVCAEFSVAFKHISGKRFFLWIHNKHGNRALSGKFCTVYPPATEVAHDMLIRLDEALTGFAGPFIRTDRRFRSSRCVSYRYGSFRTRYQLGADGTRKFTLLDPESREVPDERRPEFVLPPGMADPFDLSNTQPQHDDDADEQVNFGGYSFESVVQHSNAGGAYRARSSESRPVFIKEAWAHNGYTPDGRDAQKRLEAEHGTLRALHLLRPELCPEPIDLFTHWENTYLVTELVPGVPLTTWVATNSPIIQVEQPPRVFAEYYRRCMAILDQVERIVTTLHELGYVFIDVNPKNILIDERERVRVVDFEAALPAAEATDGSRALMGAPGYLPRGAHGLAPRSLDAYGLSAVAQLMALPLHEPVARAPEVLDHLHHDLAALAPVPDRLWDKVTRVHRRPEHPLLPEPDAVEQEPLEHLRWLRDRTADGIEAMAQPDNPRWIYPTTPAGLVSNTRCVAHGSAGVLHALRTAGRHIEPRVVARLRDESLSERHSTPPGLLFGNAGIAHVLADLGEMEAAAELLATADRHPLIRTCATFGAGAAGVAMTHLSFYDRTGDESHLTHAEKIITELPDDDALPHLLGADDASGLVNGRPGLALAAYYVARLTDDREMLDRGLRLLRLDLRHGLSVDTEALGFQVSARDTRNVPYLFAGSASYAFVLSRYLTVLEDADLAEVLHRCLRYCSVRFTVGAGLFQGLAGLAFALGQTAFLLGRRDLTANAIKSGIALFKHAIPDKDGVRFMGDRFQRFSADLWSGSAGVLLALQQLIEATPDPLFTLDEVVDPIIRRPLSVRR